VIDWRDTIDRAPFTITDYKGRSTVCESRARVLAVFGAVRVDHVVDARGTVWWDDDRLDKLGDFSGMEELDARERESKRDQAAVDAMAAEYEARLEVFGNDWKGSL